MAVLRSGDVDRARHDFLTSSSALREAAETLGPSGAFTDLEPASGSISRSTLGMAVRYTLYVLERVAPGPGVELRVAPFAAVKILEGPKSDPHNLTPPDVIELDPWVWMRLATGITTWQQEREAGHITAVGERDDLSRFLPIEA